MRSSPLGAVVWLALAAGVCAGCDCGGDEAFVVAKLTAMDGSGVERDLAASVGQWKKAQVGASFIVGDGLKTIAPSQASVELTGGGQLRVKPGTTIRFLVDGAGAGESAIDVQTGEAVLMSGNAELRLRTHVGLAVIAPGARILFGRNGEAIDYSVEVGEARFRDREGNEVVLRAGESWQVENGMAAL